MYMFFVGTSSLMPAFWLEQSLLRTNLLGKSTVNSVEHGSGQWAASESANKMSGLYVKYRANSNTDFMARRPLRDCRQCSARDVHDSARQGTQCSTSCVTQPLYRTKTLWIARLCWRTARLPAISKVNTYVPFQCEFHYFFVRLSGHTECSVWEPIPPPRWRRAIQ